MEENSRKHWRSCCLIKKLTNSKNGVKIEILLQSNLKTHYTMKQISTYSKTNAHLLTHTHISRMALYAAFLFIGVLCSVGNAWGATYFHDEFDNVGNNTDSYTSRSGWTLSNTYAHKNTGIRLGTSGGYATKTAMTNIASTKNILVTVLVADWNTDGSSLVVTVANAGNIEGNASKTISGLKAWTSTSSAVTWDNTYKVSFVVTGATSSTTIKFGTNASGKRVILGPVKFYDADAGIFKETFNSCNGTGGNDGTWSGITTGGDISVDNAGWTFVSGNKASSCARFGAGSTKGSAEMPGISYSGSNDFVLTFKAGAWTSDGTTLNLSATNATLGVSSVTLVNSTWTTYNVRVTPTSTTGIKIKWEAKNKKSNRFFLDEVWITEEAAITPSCSAPTVSATGNSSVTCTSATVTCSDNGSPAKGIVKGSCNTDEWGFFVKAGSAPTDASYDSKVVVGDESSSDSYIAAFSTSLTGLTPGTTYYVKAYAKVGATYTLSSTGTNFTTFNPTISFSVPSGVNSIADGAVNILLPEPTGFPTGINEDCWTFAGWTESSSVNSSDKPATLYPSNTYYNGSNTSDFTLYAVYSRNRYKVILDESEFEANEYYVITYFHEEHEYAVKASLTGNNANVTDIIDLTTEIQADGGYYYHINNPSKDVIWKLTGDEDEWRLSNGSLYWNLSNSSNAILQESGADIEIAQETDNNRFTFTDATTSSNNLTISSSNASITSTATYAYVYKRESTLYMTSPEDPTYTITWKVSGQSDESSDIEATGAMDDSDIPDDPTALTCTDAFVGWSTKSAGTESKTTSYYDDLFTSAADAPYLTGDATFYAVFATISSTQTYEFEITASDFNSTSYAANNNEKTSTAEATDDSGETMSVKWTSYQVMQSSGMQWQKNNGYIYNSTDLGTINSVTITSSEGTFTTYYGTSEEPSSGSSTGSGKGYFKTSVGNALGKTSSVVVNFTITTYSDYKTACSVTYDIVLDDGEVATTNNGSAKVAADAKELTDITAPTKTGYKVAGYYAESGKTNKVAAADGTLEKSVTISETAWTNSDGEWVKGSDATLYAKWEAISYSVRFNANDDGKIGTASGSMSNQDFDYGTAQNLTTNAFSLTGYTFQGWATSAGGSVAHTDGKSVSNLSTTDGDVVDLYAVWQANTYDVTLAATDETSSVGSQVVTATYGAAMPTTLKGSGDVDAPERTGYTFDGWEYSSTQYYSYNSGTSTISSAHIWDIANSTTTLTPRWNVNSYTLAWDKNGGNALTGDYTSGSVNYGATITAPNTPTRSGYDFAGWDDGSGVVTPATTMPAGDVTYTATWTKKTASGWTWTYNSAAIPDPFVIYVGINKTLDITWDPSDLLSEKKGYTVTKTDSYVAQGAKANDYYTMRGAAGVTAVTNTTVTFSLSGLSDVEINVTVKPQPRVHFVDNIHGESFDDLLPTVVSYVATFTKSTPTHSDVSDPGSNYNTCERQHIHLVGWIRSDWANEHPGASHSQITSAGNDDAGNPYYYTAGADIDVEAQDGQTFYAVWSKIE